MSCQICHSWVCRCGPMFSFTVSLTEEEKQALIAGAFVLRAAAIEHRAAKPHPLLTKAEATAQLKLAHDMASAKEAHAKVLDTLAARFSAES